MKRTFDVGLLKEWGLPYDMEEEMGEIISDDIMETSRWSEIHWMIFRAPDDLKYYRVHYSQGLTEYQDERPWEYDMEVVGLEMVQVEVTEMKWVAA